jgi:hypothetical protein
MRGHRFRSPAAPWSLTIAGAVFLALTACEQSGDAVSAQEMAWAKAALERNPNVEVVATDRQGGVITVRDRATEKVYAVTLDELAAAPVAQLAVSRAAAKADSYAESADERASSPGYGAPTDTAQQTEAEYKVVSGEPQRPDYTIERRDGQVRVTGPGLSIVSGDATPPSSARGEPGQRTVDPIVCEGRRSMHLDDRSIFVEGDAITVLGGCELYLTNSRIVASGTGVVVRDGVVHVANSYVEGGSASFDVGATARVYLRGSTFQGLLRREEVAMIEDQGGNRGLPTL